MGGGGPYESSTCPSSPILTLDWGLLGIRLDWTWDLGIELGLEKKQRIKNILS